MKTKNARYAVALSLFLCLFLPALLPVLPRAEAHNSREWQKRLDARTATLWIEGQDIGGVILNARAELNVTWADRGLLRHLESDRDVDEWLTEGLNYYFSNRKETRAKLKKRDAFVLRYRAVKYWDFDPTKLVIGGYAVTKDDILTKKEYWESGELPPGVTGFLTVCAPSLKPGQTVELSYGDTRATLAVP
ncbi:MAG: hypothetical protein LBO82_01605 [Synergistaceae bacterium]|jgi:hypothetical protein|nr:hypothetical protein [Synergistaceae bacterium]